MNYRLPPILLHHLLLATKCYLLISVNRRVFLYLVNGGEEAGGEADPQDLQQGNAQASGPHHHQVQGQGGREPEGLIEVSLEYIKNNIELVYKVRNLKIGRILK